MLELVSKAGFDLLSDLLQIIAASVFSSVIFFYAGQRTGGYKTGAVKDLLVIAAITLAGIVMPLNTFGLLPFAFMLTGLGFRIYLVLPMLVSNMVFNMLVPFNDPSFLWRNGAGHIILAFAMGMAAGILLKKIIKNPDTLLREGNGGFTAGGALSFKSILEHINRNINRTGAFLLCGVLANTIFVKLIKYSLISEIFSSQYTAQIFSGSAGLNIVHPVFLLAMDLTETLMDLAALSAVLTVLKLKGFALYVGYFLIWVAFLALSMFL